MPASASAHRTAPPEGTSAIADINGAATTSVQRFDKTDKVFAKINNNGSTIDAEADLEAIDVDGFTLNWTTNDAAATEMLYVAFGPFTPTEVRLTSFTAAKYDRGVLLEWRTGYEIDNLGFNLYREINGVRTRVNTSLIAGSGLQAGRNAGQNYARWDVDAAASDPTVTYWLEDVEFNGLSTWHGPYTPLVSELTEPVTVDSPELSDIGSANSRRIFFNYNEDQAHPGPRAVPAQVAPEVTRQWALAAHATVKMGIRKPGWYRVTQSELLAAGLNPNVDPRTLQLFVDGTEQAMRVTGQADGHLDPVDVIEFYGSGIDAAYTDTRIYWLEAGIQAGQRITAGAVGTAPSSMSTGFASTVKRKDRTQYAGGIRNGDTENWFGPTVSPAVSPTALTLTPSHIDGSAAGPAQLSVALQGLTSTTDGSTNHVVGVLVNGTEVGVMTFAGEAHAEQSFPVAIVDGENTVTLEARGGDATVDTSVVDVIQAELSPRLCRRCRSAALHAGFAKFHHGRRLCQPFDPRRRHHRSGGASGVDARRRERRERRVACDSLRARWGPADASGVLGRDHRVAGVHPGESSVNLACEQQRARLRGRLACRLHRAGRTACRASSDAGASGGRRRYRGCV